MNKTRTIDPRQQRLASKLRENLQRRKAQAKARASSIEHGRDETGDAGGRPDRPANKD